MWETVILPGLGLLLCCYGVWRAARSTVRTVEVERVVEPKVIVYTDLRVTQYPSGLVEARVDGRVNWNDHISGSEAQMIAAEAYTNAAKDLIDGIRKEL